MNILWLLTNGNTVGRHVSKTMTRWTEKCIPKDLMFKLNSGKKKGINYVKVMTLQAIWEIEIETTHETGELLVVQHAGVKNACGQRVGGGSMS